MTRRNWLATIIAPVVERLSNVRQQVHQTPWMTFGPVKGKHLIRVAIADSPDCVTINEVHFNGKRYWCFPNETVEYMGPSPIVRVDPMDEKWKDQATIAEKVLNYNLSELQQNMISKARQCGFEGVQREWLESLTARKDA